MPTPEEQKAKKELEELFEKLDKTAEEDAAARKRGNWRGEVPMQGSALRAKWDAVKRSVVHGGQNQYGNFAKSAAKATVVGAPVAIATAFLTVPPVALIAVAIHFGGTVVTELANAGVGKSVDAGYAASQSPGTIPSGKKSAIEEKDALKADAIGMIDRNLTKLNQAQTEFTNNDKKFRDKWKSGNLQSQEAKDAAYNAVRDWHEVDHYHAKLKVFADALVEAATKLQTGLKNSREKVNAAKPTLEAHFVAQI